MKSPKHIVEDLAPFADLGSGDPVVLASGSEIVVSLRRNSEEMRLSFNPDGSVTTKYAGNNRKFDKFASALASELFADLPRWADGQKALLKSSVERESIPIYGHISGQERKIASSLLEGRLAYTKTEAPRGVSVTLINAPAGFGKTSLIRSVAYRRAVNYRKTGNSLILHVESRGRMLQNVMDLIAHSLQTFRVPVTYDQIPCLVRNGLIALAIDGFDELGDPNGYDLAWAQVNDIVESVKGDGHLILAGRETFVDRSRLIKAIGTLSEERDDVDVLEIDRISPSTAKDWLKDHGEGWTDEIFSRANVAPLFEPGSYALTPYFLSEFVKADVVSSIVAGAVGDLLSFIIESMIQREATKFGEDVESLTTASQREAFVRRFMEEVARDSAENQSISIPLETITWLSEVVASEIVPASMVGILRNRASVIAFLSNDERREYRRISSERVQNYFLSAVTMKALRAYELPKYIRRNVLGVDFLSTLATMAQSETAENIDEFVERCSEFAEKAPWRDRSRQNIFSMLIAISGSFAPGRVLTISNESLEECAAFETAGEVHFVNVTVGQMYTRSADISNFYFSNGSSIVSIVADEATFVNATIPCPRLLNLGGQAVADPSEIMEWIVRRHLSALTSKDDRSVFEIGEGLPLIRLVHKLARNKTYWIRDDEADKRAQKLLRDPLWPTLKQIMEEHNMLLERKVPAAGPAATFYHIRKKDEILDLVPRSESTRRFMAALARKTLEIARNAASHIPE